MFDHRFADVPVQPVPPIVSGDGSVVRLVRPGDRRRPLDRVFDVVVLADGDAGEQRRALRPELVAGRDDDFDIEAVGEQLTLEVRSRPAAAEVHPIRFAREVYLTVAHGQRHSLVDRTQQVIGGVAR